MKQPQNNHKLFTLNCNRHIRCAPSTQRPFFIRLRPSAIVCSKRAAMATFSIDPDEALKMMLSIGFQEDRATYVVG